MADYASIRDKYLEAIAKAGLQQPKIAQPTPEPKYNTMDTTSQPSTQQKYIPYKDDTELEKLPNRVTNPALNDYVKAQQTPTPQATAAPTPAPQQVQVETPQPVQSSVNPQQVAAAIAQYNGVTIPQIDYTGQMNSANNYFDNLIKAQQAANDYKIQQQTNALNKQQSAIPEQYNNLRTQQNVRSMQDNQRLAEQLAAQGIQSSGYGDTQRIMQQTSNQNALNNYDIQQRKDIQSISDAINQLKQQGMADDNQIMLNLEAQRAQALQNLQAQQNDNAWKVYQAQYQQGRDSVGDSQWQQSFNQGVSNDQFNRGLQVAGLTGTWGGQQTLQGRQADATYQGTLIANALQQIESQYKPQILESQVTASNLANQLSQLQLQYYPQEEQYRLKQLQQELISATKANSLADLNIANQKIANAAANLNLQYLPQQLQLQIKNSIAEINNAEKQLNISQQNADTNTKSQAWAQSEVNPDNIYKKYAAEAANEKSDNALRTKAASMATQDGVFDQDLANTIYQYLKGQATSKTKVSAPSNADLEAMRKAGLIR